MTDQPRGKAFMGVAYNKPTPEESTNPADYEWISVRGQGNPGGGNSPVGTIIMFYGPEIPSGWIEIDLRDNNGHKLFYNGQQIKYILKVE